MPRTLILDLAHRYGGASERAIGLLKGFPKGEGALGSLERSPVTERARQLGLEVHCVGSHKMDPRIAGKLKHVIRTGNFQVVDSQNPQARFWAGRVSARIDIAHVATFNSWPRNEYSGHIKAYFYQLLDQVANNRTDYFIAVSKEIHAELSAAGFGPDNIALIPNGISIDTSVILSDGRWLREQFGIPASISVCCAVGRLAEVKGYRYLIESIARAKDLGEDLHCLIMGEGSLDRILKEQIRGLGIENRVRLLGGREHQEVLRIVRACDFFVMPSLSEGTPLALLEAAALGRPIVASNVGGIPNVVTNGRNGLLVLPGDVTALSKALAWVCTHPEKAAEMGQYARQVVAERFNMPRVIDAVVSAYDRATGMRVEKVEAHVP